MSCSASKPLNGFCFSQQSHHRNPTTTMATFSLFRPKLVPSRSSLRPKPSRLFSSPSTIHFPTSSISAAPLSLHHPPQTLTPFSLFHPLKPQSNRSKPLHAQTSYEIVPATDRLITIITYLLPFLNGLPYGFHLFNTYPILQNLFDPFVPIQAFYKSIPFANLVSFFVLYVGMVRDRKRFSRFVRMNALQSLMVDFILSVAPNLILTVFSNFGDWGVPLMEGTQSVIFVVFLSCFVYCFVNSVFGQTPYFKYVTGLIHGRLQLEDMMLS